jgi:hypothetical protein
MDNILLILSDGRTRFETTASAPTDVRQIAIVHDYLQRVDAHQPSRPRLQQGETIGLCASRPATSPIFFQWHIGLSTQYPVIGPMTDNRRNVPNRVPCIGELGLSKEAFRSSGLRCSCGLTNPRAPSKGGTAVVHFSQ